MWRIHFNYSPMNNSKTSGGYRRRLKSFGDAWRGIVLLFGSQFNAKIHLVILTLALLGGWYFAITPGEWVAVILAAGIVLAAEAFNTAIELLSDESLGRAYNPKIRNIKDIAAGAVLLAAIAALVTGLIIFLPYLFHFIRNIL